MNLSKEELVKLASRTKIKKNVLEKMSKKELVEFLTGVQVDKCSQKKVNQAAKKLRECSLDVPKTVKRQPDVDRIAMLSKELERLRNRLDTDNKQPKTIGDAIREADCCPVEIKSGDVCNTITITPPQSIIPSPIPPIRDNDRRDNDRRGDFRNIVNVAPLDPRVERIDENIVRIDSDIIDLKSKTSQLGRQLETNTKELEAEQLRHEKLSEDKHRQFTANLTDIVGRVDDLLDGLRTMQRRDLEFGTRVQEAFAMENAALLNENFQEARRAAREEVAELVDETVSRVARNLNQETRQQAIDAAAAAARNVVENSSSIIAAVDSAFQSRLNETVDAQVAAGLADVVLPEVVRLLRVERAAVDAQLLDLQSSLSNLESLQINVSQLELLLQQVDNEVTSVRDDVRTLESENDASNARIRNISSELRSTNATLDELRSTVTDLRNYIDNDVSERVQAFVNNQQQLAIEQYDLAIRQTIDNLNSGILVRVDEVAQQVSEELRTIDTRVDSAVQELRRELTTTSQSVVRQQEESNEDRDARITRQVNELFNRAREYAKRIVEERQIEFKSAVDRMALSEDVESINATLSDQTASLRQQMNQNYSQLENRLVVSERSIGANEDALRQTIGDVAVVNDRTNRLDDQMRDQLRITDEFGNVLNQVRRTIPAIESRLANVENVDSLGSLDSLVSNQQMQISRVETIEREMIRLNNELSRPNVELDELDNRVVAIEESRQELERLLRNEQNQNAIVNRQLKELQDAFRVVRDAMDDRLATNSSSINNIIRELRSNRRSIEPSPSDNDRLDQMSSEINTLRITMGQFEVRLSELESTVNVSVDARINQLQRQLSTAVASSPIKRRRVLE